MRADYHWVLHCMPCGMLLWSNSCNLGVSVRVRAACICVDVGLVALRMESPAGRVLQSLDGMLPPARRKA